MEGALRERAKQGASNQPREASGARGTRSGCQLMGSACSSGTSVAVKAATADSRHTPSSRGRGPLPSLLVEEPEVLNDLDVDVVGSSTSKMASDAALAQLLQGDEYNKASNQRCGRVPSDYELAKQVQVQTDAEIAMHMQANVHRRHSNGHCHHDSNGGHRWVEERGGRVPTPSDYVLAKHVQEQEDAEIAMNVQARDVQSTEGNAYPDHDSSYHDHNSSSHNSNGVFSNGGHRWMEEGGGHPMLLQSDSSQYNEVRGGPGSSSGRGPGSSDYEIAQEQMDGEEALRVQAREMQSASHRLEEGERPLLPQAAHNSHSMQQQAAQQMDLTYEVHIYRTPYLPLPGSQ